MHDQHNCAPSWLVSLQPADQTPLIQSEKSQCRIDTGISPDDGHMVAQNI